MSSLAHRRLVVIGGSSGIGYEVARQARAQGARLAITGRDKAKLAAALQRLSGNIAAFELDAHDEDALREFFLKIGSFDHLVSLVGDTMAGGFLTVTPETMRHVLHSKFWTNWRIAAHAASIVSDGGSLTFTSGTGGRPHEISASYVSNLGIRALVEGLAVEMAPRVRVNAVAPTFMGTPFWRQMPAVELEKALEAFAAGVPLNRVATVEEVASAYMHVMTNGFVTGQVLSVDGGVMLLK